MEFIEDYEFYNLEGKQILMEIKQHFTESQIYALSTLYNPFLYKNYKVLCAYNHHDIYRLYKFLSFVDKHCYKLGGDITYYEFVKIIEGYNKSNVDYEGFKMNEHVFFTCFYGERLTEDRVLSYISEFIKEYIKNSPL